jgi:hypothetical protein
MELIGTLILPQKRIKLSRIQLKSGNLRIEAQKNIDDIIYEMPEEILWTLD